MVCCVRICVLASLLAIPPSAFADNLIPNPDFTQLLTGWSRAPAFAANIEADFSVGSPAPPSAHVSGNGAIVSGSIVAPCFPADGLDHVDFRFDTLVAAGVARGLVGSYSDTACTDPIDAITTPDALPSQDWTTVSLSDVALAPGTHSVAVSMYAYSADGAANGDAYFDHVAFGPTGTLPEAININQEGLSGAWYDPAESGQGFQFSITPAMDAEATGALFGAWYTYDTVAGSTESQRWYSLQASLAADAITADITIYQNTGGAFAGPPTTSATPVGTGTLAFDSCTSGTFAYTLDDGRTGEIALKMLLPNPLCAETGTPPELTGPSTLSGAWYNPATSGQGVLINVDDFIGQVFVGWYTYAPDGAASGADGQRWFSVQGSYGIGGPLSLAVYESTGGVFDTAGSATTRPVGTATLTFASCSDATLDYTFNDGELVGQSGRLDLSRLGVTPANCALTP